MEFNVNVFLLQLATFLVGMWLSSILFLPMLKGWMRDRQKRIEDQMEAAQKGQKDAEALKREFEEKVRRLEQDSAEILQKARREAAQAREETVQAARKEAELILSDGRKAIEGERKALSLSLQKEVGGLAVDIAERILRASVDGKVQDRIVRESIQELNAGKN